MLYCYFSVHFDGKLFSLSTGNRANLLEIHYCYLVGTNHLLGNCLSTYLPSCMAEHSGSKSTMFCQMLFLSSLINSVLQGNVLSPIHFIIYINDVMSNQSPETANPQKARPTNPKKLLYADDLKCYNEIHNVSDPKHFLGALSRRAVGY